MGNLVKNEIESSEDSVTQFDPTEGNCYNYLNAMWLILQNKRCPFIDGQTYKRLTDCHTTTTPPDFKHWPVGPPISVGACLVQTPGTAPIYLINNGKKHHLTSWKGNISGNYVESIASYALHCIPTGDPI